MKAARCSAAALALLLAACAGTPPGEVLPLAGLPMAVADMEAKVALGAGPVVVPRPERPRVPDSDVRAQREGDAVVLRWQQAWHALLSVQAERPLDLSRFVPRGTLEFEVRAGDLSRSGFSVSMDCGPGCTRRVNHVRASRALSGRGWQRLSLAVACFDRDGADFRAVQRPFVIESSGSGDLAVRGMRLVERGTPNVACPDWRTQSVTPQPLEEVWSMDWWMPRHAQKLAQIRERPPALVFIGDSITHGWENEGRAAWERAFAPHGALNLGYGGDRTENVLWRLQHGELDGYRARAVVLMIGTNNTGDRQEDPATTAAGVKRLLDEIARRQPQAQVLLLGLFPRDPLPDSRLRRLNTRVNDLLRGLADGRRVHYLDIGDRLANPDGTLSPEILPDWLHLSPAGYERWAAAIEPTLRRLLSP